MERLPCKLLSVKLPPRAVRVHQKMVFFDGKHRRDW